VRCHMADKDTGKLVDWVNVNWRIGVAMGEGHLTVTGTLPQSGTVRLIERDGADDHWEVQVLAFGPSAGPEMLTPFTVQRYIHAREGNLGFELVGATKREQIHLELVPTGVEG